MDLSTNLSQKETNSPPPVRRRIAIRRRTKDSQPKQRPIPVCSSHLQERRQYTSKSSSLFQLTNQRVGSPSNKNGNCSKNGNSTQKNSSTEIEPDEAYIQLHYDKNEIEKIRQRCLRGNSITVERSEALQWMNFNLAPGVHDHKNFQLSLTSYENNQFYYLQELSAKRINRPDFYQALYHLEYHFLFYIQKPPTISKSLETWYHWIDEEWYKIFHGHSYYCLPQIVSMFGGRNLRITDQELLPLKEQLDQLWFSIRDRWSSKKSYQSKIRKIEERISKYLLVQVQLES